MRSWIYLHRWLGFNNIGWSGLKMVTNPHHSLSHLNMRILCLRQTSAMSSFLLIGAQHRQPLLFANQRCGGRRFQLAFEKASMVDWIWGWNPALKKGGQLRQLRYWSASDLVAVLDIGGAMFGVKLLLMNSSMWVFVWSVSDLVWVLTSLSCGCLVLWMVIL